MMTHQPKSRRPRYDDDEYDDQYNDRYDDKQPRSFKKKSRNPLNQIPMDWMLSIGSIAVIFEASREVSITSYSLVAAWIALSAVVLMYTDKASAAFYSNYRKFFKQYGSTGLVGVLFMVLAITSLFFAIAEPSQAIFLSGAEESFNGVFGDQGDSKASVKKLVSLVFGVIRLIMLLAVIFGVIKAIQARDDSEQVKTQLMLPFIILVGVATVDAMTFLIFGK